MVKAVDSKSIGLVPHQFKSGRCRFLFVLKSPARPLQWLGEWDGVATLVLLLFSASQGWNYFFISLIEQLASDYHHTDKLK